jgi:hypothetical protein
MAVQRSVDARNAALDSFETTVGTTPLLRIYSGSMPANAAAAATGDLLCEITLPSDWLSAASSGTKSKSGTWAELTADDDGTAGYYRIYESTGTTCHEQGECTDTGGAGPMKLSSTTIVAGQPVTIATYVITAGNA